MNARCTTIVMTVFAMLSHYGVARTETRLEDCSTCGGNGKVICSACKGEGWIPMCGEKPNLIDASVSIIGSAIQLVTGTLETTLTAETETLEHIGYNECLACHGHGHMTCSDCKGGGITLRTVRVPESATATTTIPQGTAQKSSYDLVLRSIAVIRGCCNGYSWSGTGFIARDGDSTYLYTNQHVVLHNGEYADTLRAEFVDGSYIDLTPRSAYFPKDERDVARFLVEGCDGRALTIYAEGPTQGESICIYGNSMGKGVITQAEGKILGVGIDGLMEHSCDTAQGNSGSPILDVNLDVVGIDTVSIQDMPEEGTVFADSRYYRVRNFGTSVVGINWY